MKERCCICGGKYSEMKYYKEFYLNTKGSSLKIENDWVCYTCKDKIKVIQK
jgi:hypothetical protein